MSNERLRKQMLYFAMVFMVVGIIVIYLKDFENKKHGVTDHFGGVLNSDWKREYYDNGHLKSEGELRKGYLKEGDWVYYREDGSIMLREKYKDGILVEVTEDGK
jgi:antitoxin component YwqK of YwqJK toxin-antitoxin module